MDVPKIWQILNEDEEIYNAMDRFIEAADWIIWQLCGEETRNSCTAGYKAMCQQDRGIPPTISSRRWIPGWSM